MMNAYIDNALREAVERLEKAIDIAFLSLPLAERLKKTSIITLEDPELIELLKLDSVKAALKLKYKEGELPATLEVHDAGAGKFQISLTK